MSDYTPFKMNGFSGFGNSPMKQNEEEVKDFSDKSKYKTVREVGLVVYHKI